MVDTKFEGHSESANFVKVRGRDPNFLWWRSAIVFRTEESAPLSMVHTVPMDVDVDVVMSSPDSFFARPGKEHCGGPLMPKAS